MPNINGIKKALTDYGPVLRLHLKTKIAALPVLDRAKLTIDDVREMIQAHFERVLYQTLRQCLQVKSEEKVRALAWQPLMATFIQSIESCIEPQKASEKEVLQDYPPIVRAALIHFQYDHCLTARINKRPTVRAVVNAIAWLGERKAPESPRQTNALLIAFATWRTPRQTEAPVVGERVLQSDQIDNYPLDAKQFYPLFTSFSSLTKEFVLPKCDKAQCLALLKRLINAELCPIDTALPWIEAIVERMNKQKWVLTAEDVSELYSISTIDLKGNSSFEKVHKRLDDLNQGRLDGLLANLDDKSGAKRSIFKSHLLEIGMLRTLVPFCDWTLDETSAVAPVTVLGLIVDRFKQIKSGADKSGPLDAWSLERYVEALPACIEAFLDTCMTDKQDEQQAHITSCLYLVKTVTVGMAAEQFNDKLITVIIQTLFSQSKLEAKEHAMLVKGFAGIASTTTMAEQLYQLEYFKAGFDKLSGSELAALMKMSSWREVLTQEDCKLLNELVTNDAKLLHLVTDVDLESLVIIVADPDIQKRIKGDASLQRVVVSRNVEETLVDGCLATDKLSVQARGVVLVELCERLPKGKTQLADRILQVYRDKTDYRDDEITSLITHILIPLAQQAVHSDFAKSQFKVLFNLVRKQIDELIPKLLFDERGLVVTACLCVLFDLKETVLPLVVDKIGAEADRVSLIHELYDMLQADKVDDKAIVKVLLKACVESFTEYVSIKKLMFTEGREPACRQEVVAWLLSDAHCTSLINDNISLADRFDVVLFADKFNLALAKQLLIGVKPLSQAMLAKLVSKFKSDPQFIEFVFLSNLEAFDQDINFDIIQACLTASPLAANVAKIAALVYSNVRTEKIASLIYLHLDLDPRMRKALVERFLERKQHNAVDITTLIDAINLREPFAEAQETDVKVEVMRLAVFSDLHSCAKSGLNSEYIANMMNMNFGGNGVADSGGGVYAAFEQSMQAEDVIAYLVAAKPIAMAIDFIKHCSKVITPAVIAAVFNQRDPMPLQLALSLMGAHYKRQEIFDLPDLTIKAKTEMWLVLYKLKDWASLQITVNVHRDFLLPCLQALSASDNADSLSERSFLETEVFPRLAMPDAEKVSFKPDPLLYVSLEQFCALVKSNTPLPANLLKQIMPEKFGFAEVVSCYQHAIDSRIKYSDPLLQFLLQRVFEFADLHCLFSNITLTGIHTMIDMMKLPESHLQPIVSLLFDSLMHKWQAIGREQTPICQVPLSKKQLLALREIDSGLPEDGLLHFDKIHYDTVTVYGNPTICYLCSDVAAKVQEITETLQEKKEVSLKKGFIFGDNVNPFDYFDRQTEGNQRLHLVSDAPKPVYEFK